MYSAFQSNAFQNNAFQIITSTSVIPSGGGGGKKRKSGYKAELPYEINKRSVLADIRQVGVDKILAERKAANEAIGKPILPLEIDKPVLLAGGWQVPPASPPASKLAEIAPELALLKAQLEAASELTEYQNRLRILLLSLN